VGASAESPAKKKKRTPTASGGKFRQPAKKGEGGGSREGPLGRKGSGGDKWRPKWEGGTEGGSAPANQAKRNHVGSEKAGGKKKKGRGGEY